MTEQPSPTPDSLSRNVLIEDDCGFRGRWVAIPREDFDALRAALADSARASEAGGHTGPLDVERLGWQPQMTTGVQKAIAYIRVQPDFGPATKETLIAMVRAVADAAIADVERLASQTANADE